MTKIEDVVVVVSYLKTKPTGATLAEAKAVLGSTPLDGRKLAAYQAWDLVRLEGDKLSVTAKGRQIANAPDEKAEVLRGVIRSVAPYLSAIERAYHQPSDRLTVDEVAAFWFEHHKEEAGTDSDTSLKSMVTCFFNLAEGAGLGTYMLGRAGSQTRLEMDKTALQEFVGDASAALSDDFEESPPAEDEVEGQDARKTEQFAEGKTPSGPKPIFVGHGKQKGPLKQLTKVLDGLKIPYKVAEAEPNLGRPIPTKVKAVMDECGSAIVLFTKDEKLKNADGEEIWRPNENVTYELGAASFAYDDKIVIFKEDGVDFPTNFDRVGHISFGDEGIEAKTMDLIKELVGFGLVAITPTASG